MKLSPRFSSILLISLNCVTMGVYALPFSITPNGELPPYILLNGLKPASYTITNTSLLNAPRNMVKWLPPNVSINPTGTTCLPASAFSLAAGQSCILNLSVSSVVSSNDPDPHHHLFICMSDRMTCAGPAPQASLNVALKTHNRVGYITNLSSNEVLRCTINMDGSFEECSASNPGVTFMGPAGINLNTNNTIAYVGNSSNSTISICPLNPDGTLKTCTVKTDATFMNSPWIAINTANTFAYVPTYNGATVSVCPVNTDGSLGTCTASNPGGTFNRPDVVALDPLNQYLYVTNTQGNTVSVCPINADGSLGMCTASNPGNTFSSPTGISINAAGTFAYINNLTTVSVCPINTDHSLGTCTAYNPSGTFGNIGFGKNAINAKGTLLYVASAGNNNISICTINKNGSLGPCTATTLGGILHAPQGIAFNLVARV